MALGLICRTPPTLGKSIIRFEPRENERRTCSLETDIFDALLGHAPFRRGPAEIATRKSCSEHVWMRLDFDDAVVSPESAAAYLERLSFHIESPELIIL